jgi:UDP-2,4-diacetamido-2,4,6-trideoxy-beta-L-altropyranose hydrolase
MIIFFRVDASIEIGSGHVSRCLKLANAFVRLGFSVEFITKNHNGNLIANIKDGGFYVHILEVSNYFQGSVYSGEDYSLWLGSGWEQDANLTIGIISKYTDNILIVDHYGIDGRWENAVKQMTNRLVVIDDLANRSHACNLLVDQGLGRKDADYKKFVDESCRLLTGEKFLMLSPEFKKYRRSSQSKVRGSYIKSWLVSMGGVDKSNATSDAIKALENIYAGDQIKLEVVLGRASPWVSEVKSMITKSNLDIKLHIDAKNMAEIVSNSDCVIGGAGISSLERAYLGVPSIALVMADNQKRGAIALEAFGVSKVIYETENFYHRLIENIYSLRSDACLLNAMMFNGLSLLDGDGLDRVVGAILER